MERSSGLGGGWRISNFFLETFGTSRANLDAVISATYTAAGRSDRTTERERSEKEANRGKYPSVGYYKSQKAYSRFDCQQEFIKSCKAITDFIKLSQSEIERANILEYIQYSIIVSDIIKKENENIEKLNKKSKND